MTDCMHGSQSTSRGRGSLFVHVASEVHRNPGRQRKKTRRKINQEDYIGAWWSLRRPSPDKAFLFFKGGWQSMCVSKVFAQQRGGWCRRIPHRQQRRGTKKKEEESVQDIEIGLINEISVQLTSSSLATCIMHMTDCMHASWHTTLNTIWTRDGELQPQSCSIHHSMQCTK